MENENSYRSILERVIIKGGLIGFCAKLYLNDATKAKLYIWELSEMSHSESMNGFFGKELIKDINKFVLDST